MHSEGVSVRNGVVGLLADGKKVKSTSTSIQKHNKYSP